MFKHNNSEIDTYIGSINGLDASGTNKQFDIWWRKHIRRDDQVLLRHGSEPHEYEAFSEATIALAIERAAWPKADTFARALVQAKGKLGI